MPQRRILSHTAKEVALAAAHDMRRVAVLVCTEAPIASPAYQAASDVLTALDKLAEALTGKPDFLHTPHHTAGGRYRPG
jgi:hypothetical protein